MGISVGAKVAQASGASVDPFTATLGQTRSGSAIVALVLWDVGGPTFTSIADSFTNTWNQIGAEVNTGVGGVIGRAYYAENITGGNGHTITLDLSGAAFSAIIAVEVRLGLTSGISDGTPTGNADAATPFTAPAITTSNANDLLVGLIGSNSTTGETFTPGNSFNTAVERTGAGDWSGSIAVRTVSATGTYNPTWTFGTGNSSVVFFIALQEDANQNITHSNDGCLRHIVRV